MKIDRKISGETLDKLIERQQKPGNFVRTRYVTYGSDSKYVAYVETKNKQYLFMKDCFENKNYMLLKTYNLKK